MSIKRSAFAEFSYEHLKEELELRNGFGPSDAIFALGILVGSYSSPDVDEAEKPMIKALLLEAVESPVPFIAERCRVFAENESKRNAE